MAPDTATDTARRYFRAMESALSGLSTFFDENETPNERDEWVAAVVAHYIGRLGGSFKSWEHRFSLESRFRISQAESGFPVFQHVLDLENDRSEAEKRLAGMQEEKTIRKEMVDFILRKKAFPKALQRTMAERRYLQGLIDGHQFSPLVLPRTISVSVNPKTGRPYYLVHWGYFDGVANLPLIYMAGIEDSSSDMVATLVTAKGTLNRKVDIPLPVDGLLNPNLAHRFDEFCDKNSAYSLTLSTIATSLDKDFEHLHPKLFRRFVLGPFYHADITVHGGRVDKILKKVKRPENQWLLSWSLQELYSVREKPAKWGLWGGDPARQEFFINTDDLDCARMGVSDFENHVLVPHEAYQAIFASGEAETIFDNYKTHVISGNQVLRNF